MFLGIDRVSKFTYVEFHDRTKLLKGTEFLENVIEAFPYRIHTILTDNGIAFADLPKNRSGISRQWGPHMFDQVCMANGIEHKLTKPYHPWTNGPGGTDEPNHQGRHKARGAAPHTRRIPGLGPVSPPIDRA